LLLHGAVMEDRYRQTGPQKISRRTVNRYFSTVGGGYGNTANGAYSTVGGGQTNTANGPLATVPGGAANVAGGFFSFAAGYRAKVRDATSSGDVDGDNGTFVWADSTDADFTSTGPNQFLIRSTGGMRLATGDGSTPQFQAILPSTDTGTNLAINPLGGNVGIGTNAPGAALDVAGNVYSTSATGGRLVALNPDNQSAAVQLSWLNDVPRIRISGSGAGSANGFDIQGIGDSSKLRILDNGNVGIGTTAPTAKLHVVGDIVYTGTITDISDERLKDNISPVGDALAKIQRLRGVYFNMNDTPDRRDVGLIAQDVQAVLPEAVQVIDPANGYLGVAYPSVVPLLVEAIKAQAREMEQQECLMQQQQQQQLHLEKNQRLEELAARLERLEKLLNEVKDGD
jgi:hypothetical protein